tara:strand:- start:14235 stop:14933 length:699 start_codon:yes stop_codon:yes gene_type:complete
MSGSRFRSLPRFSALDGQPTTDALGEHINLLTSVIEQNILEIDRAVATEDLDLDTGFEAPAIGTATVNNAQVGSSADIAITKLDLAGATTQGDAINNDDVFFMLDLNLGTDTYANSDNKKVRASRIKTYVSDLTLTTAAQTAITSVGTLTGLTVTASGTAAKLQYTGSSGNPCVTLDQDDADAPFIDFDGTAGAANTNSVVTTTGNVSGGINRFIKVKQGGTTYYMPLYAAS